MKILSGSVTRLLNEIKKLIALKGRIKNKSALWDWEYKTNKWEILKSPMEEARFNTLVELIREYCDGARILEIGCGEGLLLRKFTLPYRRFLGIDISQIAITRASDLKNEKTSFAAADMEIFVPPETLDVIIFNESVYYSKDPVGLIKRYMKFLDRNGVIATSIYGNNSGIAVVDRLEREFRCLKKEITKNQRGTWYCHIIEGPINN